MMIGLEVVGQSYVKLLLMGLHMNIWRERERERERENAHYFALKPYWQCKYQGLFTCQERTVKLKLN